MKLWQKIFFTSLLLLVFILGLVNYIFLRKNYKNTLNETRQQSIQTFEFVIHSLQSSLLSVRYQKIYADSHTAAMSLFPIFLSETEVLDLITPLLNQLATDESSSAFNQTQHVIYTEITQNNHLVYQNLPAEIVTQLPLRREELSFLNDKNEYHSIIRHLDGHYYLFVSGYVLFEQVPYVITFTSNLDALYAQLNAKTLSIAYQQLFFSFLIALILLIISFLLTKPIRLLRLYTSEIKAGHYNIRKNFKGHDELAELGHDFNEMAAVVEEKIQKLENYTKDQEQFVENISHEIKTPLTTILGFSALLKDDPTLPAETVEKYADFILQEGTRLKQLSQILLELALLKKTDFTKESVDLKQFLSHFVEHYQLKAEEYDLTLELSSTKGLIMINKDLFISLLANLVDNAAKASFKNNKIFITATISTENICTIRIKDTGIGIPEAELDSIRIPFYTLDKARTKKAGGAGLGLAICEKIIHLHQGHLLYDSTLGIGTIVSIVFPTGGSDEKNN